MMTEKVREVERIKKDDGSDFILRLPNGKQGEEYKAILLFEKVFWNFKSFDEHIVTSKTTNFILKEVSGKELGITCQLANDKKSLIISGVVSKELNGNFELELVLDGDKPKPMSYKGTIFVNPDPRLLWKNIPTDPDIEFYKEDEDFASISADGTVVSKKKVPSRVKTKKVLDEKLSQENVGDINTNTTDKNSVTETIVDNNVVEFGIEESSKNDLNSDDSEKVSNVKSEDKNSAQQDSTETKDFDIKNIEKDSVQHESTKNKDEQENENNSTSQQVISDDSDKKSKDTVDDSSNISILEKFKYIFCNDKCNDNIVSDNGNLELQSSEDQVPYEKVITKELGSENQIKKFERLNIIAGSKRGRSHAHEGTPRDDDFAIDYIEESGWHIAVVADGAGSAKYSREGSRIACDVVIKTCRDKLQNNNEIDTLFGETKNLKSKSEEEKLKDSLKNKFYEILPQAAFEAKKHLEKLSSDTDGSSLKDFSTTLLICLCKKYDDLWCFITFSIGDGAIALYGNDEVRNLSDGDSGEFAGQTRFITMNSVYKSEELFERIKLAWERNFDALFMMTDGISDPKFETDSNLTKDSKWKEFYKEFEESVGIKKLTPNESSQEILKWLDFWSPGNHDDRTIVVMYK